MLEGPGALASLEAPPSPQVSWLGLSVLSGSDSPCGLEDSHESVSGHLLWAPSANSNRHFHQARLTNDL